MKFVKAVKLDSVLGNLARPPDRVLIRTVQLHQTVQVVKIEKKKKKKLLKIGMTLDCPAARRTSISTSFSFAAQATQWEDEDELAVTRTPCAPTAIPNTNFTNP